jgi:hypothetical protein
MIRAFGSIGFRAHASRDYRQFSPVACDHRHRLAARNGGQPWMVPAYVVFAALVSAFCVSRVGRRNASANSR